MQLFVHLRLLHLFVRICVSVFLYKSYFHLILYVTRRCRVLRVLVLRILRICIQCVCHPYAAWNPLFFYCFHDIIPMLKCVFSAFYYRYVHKSYLFFAVAILVAIL